MLLSAPLFAQESRLSRVRLDMATVKALQTPLPTPKQGDWRYERTEEEQTFTAYRAQVRTYGPIKDDTRRYLYVWPLGTFNDTQKNIIKKTCDFLAIYYGLPVRVYGVTSLKTLPDAARVKRIANAPQIDADYLLDRVLAPQLPADAVAMVGITSEDLHPNRGWNLRYAFGMSQIYKRISVASMNRLGDPARNREEFTDCLRRTLKIVSHEVGHTFLMQHCTTFTCNMNGLNNRRECDSQPLWLCSECAAKMCWALDLDALKRYEQLAAFCQANRLQTEETYYTKAANAVRSARTRTHQLRTTTSATSANARQSPTPRRRTFSLPGE